MSSGVSIPVGVDDKATGPVDRIRDRFDTLGKSAGVKSFTTGLGMGAGIGVFNLATSAISGVASAMSDMVKGAIDDEESQNRLRASLQANIPGWDGNTDAIEANIKAKQRLGFDDETLRDSLTVLAGATGDVTKAQQIQNVAMDLARYKGIDLRTASEALIKVQGGQYRALKQLGIELRDGATSTEALAAVQKVASGQAEAYGKTTKGSMEAIGIAMSEVGESIGAALMPVLQALIPIIRDKLLPVIEVLATFLGKALEALAPLVGFILDVAMEAFRALANIVLSTGEALLTVAAAIPGPWQEGAASMRDAVADMKAGLNDVLTSATTTAEDVGPATGDALAAGATEVQDGAETAFEPIPEEADKAGGKAQQSLAGWLTSMVSDLRASKNEFVGAWRAVLNASQREQEIGLAITKNLSEQKAQAAILSDKKASKSAKDEARARLATLEGEHAELLAEQSTYGTQAEQITRTNALLQSKAMVAGLKSADPDVRAYWEGLRDVTVSRLVDLKTTSGTVGGQTATAFAKGLGGRPGLAAVKGSAEGVATTARTTIKTNAVDKADNWGTSFTTSFAAGVRAANAIRAVIAAVMRVIGVISNLFKGESPPKEGPLHYIDVWGENVGKAWAGGLAKGATGRVVAPALGTLASALTPSGGAGAGVAGGGSSSIVLNVSLRQDAVISTASQAQLDQAARTLGPAIVRELRGRGLIPQGSY